MNFNVFVPRGANPLGHTTPAPPCVWVESTLGRTQGWNGWSSMPEGLRAD